MYYGSYFDVVAQGAPYLDMFTRDYYSFLKELDAVISLDAFAREWTAIPSGPFSRLTIGDIIFLREKTHFEELVVIAEPVWREDEELYMVTARIANKPPLADNEVYVFSDGGIYAIDQSTQHTPTQYRFLNSKALSEGGVHTCPIRLITTKTKAQSS